VVSQYPAISHAFLLQEVETLRSLGAIVETFSIRRVGENQLLTDADRRAFDTTYAIVPPRWGHLAAALMRATLTRPHRFARALRSALALRKPGLRGTLWQLFYLLESVLLWDRCRRLGVRHVHAQFASSATDAALLAAELGGDAWSWSFTVHGPVEFYDVPGFQLAEKARRALFVTCISDFARSQLLGFLEPATWPRVEVVRMGVDADRFRPPAEPRARREGPLRLLTLGRLAGVKGQAVLLDAVAEVARRGVAVQLKVVGAGPERGRLEGRASDLGIAEQVEFAGAVGHDRTVELYAEADVFCTSSFAEGLPVVLMEAMATELPVIATRIMGIPELVEGGVSGRLVAPARPDALADAIEWLAARPDARVAMGQAGRRKVLEEHNLRRSGERMLELLEQRLPAA
jgi:glycosyltransferase involved in cell wall biosynthesis